MAKLASLTGQTVKAFMETERGKKIIKDTLMRGGTLLGAATICASIVLDDGDTDRCSSAALAALDQA